MVPMQCHVPGTPLLLPRRTRTGWGCSEGVSRAVAQRDTSPGWAWCWGGELGVRPSVCAARTDITWEQPPAVPRLPDILLSLRVSCIHLEVLLNNPGPDAGWEGDKTKDSRGGRRRGDLEGVGVRDTALFWGGQYPRRSAEGWRWCWAALGERQPCPGAAPAARPCLQRRGRFLRARPPALQCPVCVSAARQGRCSQQGHVAGSMPLLQVGFGFGFVFFLFAKIPVNSDASLNLTEGQIMSG